MKEVEIKIPLNENQWFEVKKQLTKLGYALVREVKEEDIYFNSPHRNFAETDETLRVRRSLVKNNGDYVVERQELTYKGPKLGNSMKIREEISVGIEDADKTRVLLEALGFIEITCVVKERSYYQKDRVIVSLDDVMGLGHFMEIEMQVQESDLLEKYKNHVQKVASALLSTVIFTDERRSYLELLLEKKNINAEK